MTVKEQVRNDAYVIQTKLMLKRGMLTLLEAVSSVNERWSKGLMTLEEAEEAVRQIARMRAK